ncbi:MAG: hypothetical protein NTX24_04520 [Candidatus Pacearchaeota archaeon]|nr:hypothetical protein [Candidatus Pacearchaeota archaeon]
MNDLISNIKYAAMTAGFAYGFLVITANLISLVVTSDNLRKESLSRKEERNFFQYFRDYMRRTDLIKPEVNKLERTLVQAVLGSFFVPGQYLAHALPLENTNK